jgi:hypothetical protein
VTFGMFFIFFVATDIFNALRYKLVTHAGDQLLIVVLPGTAVQASLPLKKSRSVRPTVRLPFGISLPKKARCRKSTKPQNHSGLRSANRVKKQSDPSRVQSPQCDSSHSDFTHASDPSSGPSESDTALSASISSLDSSDEEAVEEPKVIPTSEAFLLELSAAKAEEPQTIVRSSTAAGFFTSHTGVLGCEVAPVKSRGRPTTCFHCQCLVEKGQPRFSYSYNVKRPWKYLHDFCLVPLVRSKNSQESLEQATAFCADFQLRSDQPQLLRDSVSHVLLQLLSTTASSSSS